MQDSSSMRLQTDSCHIKDICLTAKLILRHLTDKSRKVKHYSIQVNSIPVFGKSAGPLIYSSAGFITKNNCCFHNSNSVSVQ